MIKKKNYFIYKRIIIIISYNITSKLVSRISRVSLKPVNILLTENYKEEATFVVIMVSSVSSLLDKKREIISHFVLFRLN